MAHVPTTGLSWDQLDHLFPDLACRELHDGVLRVTPSPAWWHQDAVLWLGRKLGSWADDHQARVFIAPLDVIAAIDRVYQPDVAVLVGDYRSRIAPDGKLHGAPDLVAEILSPTTRVCDSGAKRSAYAALGVAEHWLVDLDAATLAVSRLEADSYPARPVVLTKTDTLTTPLLPGFALPLDRLLTRM